MRRVCYITIQLLISFFFTAPVHSQVRTHGEVSFTIDTNKKSAETSTLIYGQFIELLFNYFEGGLWAEMLGDRKFFYPVNTAVNRIPVDTRNYLGKWAPAGGSSFVAMDSTQILTGAHSVQISLEYNVAHGISQSGLTLQKGRLYTGYVIIDASPGAAVELIFKSAGREASSQVISLKNISHSFHRYPFTFKSAFADSNATCLISGKGRGVMHIGAVSLMPADNISGFRADILNNLRDMHLGMLRWGGNASSGYNWRDGVGDRDKRAPRYDYAWKAMESNDVGTDEYLTLCSLLKVTPYIGVNAGLGDAFSAGQWVQYVNGSASSAMGAIRKKNGHASSYGVKWWGIGNEMYGEWQLGHMSLDNYIVKHHLFAIEMKKQDSSVLLVASGATPFETGSTSVYTLHPENARLPYSIGSANDWSAGLLRADAVDMNFLAEHLYPISDSAYDETAQKFRFVADSLSDRIRRLPNRIEGATEAFAMYCKSNPVMKVKDIKIALDEWRMKDGWGLEDALATAEGYNEIVRHTDVIKMSAYTSTNAPLGLLYTATASAIQPNGLVIKMYSDHLGTIPLAVTGNSVPPQVSGTTGVDRPVKSSGGSTYPLDIVATYSHDLRTVSVAVVNPTRVSQQLNINWKGTGVVGPVKKWVLAGNDLRAINLPGKKPSVSIVPSNLSQKELLAVDPLSVTIYEFSVK